MSKINFNNRRPVLRLNSSHIENPFKIDESFQSNIFRKLARLCLIFGMLGLFCSIINIFYKIYEYNEKLSKLSSYSYISSYKEKFSENFSSIIITTIVYSLGLCITLFVMSAVFNYLHIVCKAVIENNTYLKHFHKNYISQEN